LLRSHTEGALTSAYAVGLDDPYLGLVLLESTKILPADSDLLASLRVVMQSEAQRWARDRAQQQRQRFNQLLLNCLAAADLGNALAVVSRHVAERFNVDAVRIATIDEGGFLQSRALHSEVTEVMVPAKGTQVLSLMPNHETVIATGKPLFLQRDTAATTAPESEWHQMFSDKALAALLMPIVRHGRTWGVMTLLSCDQVKARHLQHLAMENELAPVAGLLALMLTRPTVSAGDTSTYPEVMFVPRRRTVGTGELRARLRSSLAGIVASTEALRRTDSADKEKVQRYLSVIDRSADKIKQFVDSSSLAE
jgi:signal transduction histidine kinase